MIFNEQSMVSMGNIQEEFDSIMSQFLSVCHKVSTEKED
jgi:hypothetical protein